MVFCVTIVYNIPLTLGGFHACGVYDSLHVPLLEPIVDSHLPYKLTITNFNGIKKFLPLSKEMVFGITIVYNISLTWDGFHACGVHDSPHVRKMLYTTLSLSLNGSLFLRAYLFLPFFFKFNLKQKTNYQKFFFFKRCLQIILKSENNQFSENIKMMGLETIF